MGIFMNTRHSGNESGHVTAELEALTNEATLGAGNYVFEAGNKFSITVTPVTGDVNISNGVFSWCGRLGGVESFANAKYTPPSSETLYKKVVIGAKYTKNSASLVENISLAAVESEIQSSESAAAGVTLTLDSDEIKPDTISAFLPLWEFTVNSKTHSTPVKMFNTVNNLRFLLNKAGELSNQIAAEATARANADSTIQKSVSDETTARKNADTGLDNRLKEIEKRYELISNSMANNQSYTVDMSKYRMICVTIETASNSTYNVLTFPAITGSFRIPMHFFKKVTIGHDIDTVYVTASISDTSIKFNTSGTTDHFVFKELYGIK